MYQTALPHIYAVGDVIGYQAASAAYDQGRIAAQALVKGEASAHLIEDIPTDLYYSGNQLRRENRAAADGDESAV